MNNFVNNKLVVEIIKKINKILRMLKTLSSIIKINPFNISLNHQYFSLLNNKFYFTTVDTSKIS